MSAPKGNKFAGSRKGVPNKRTTEWEDFGKKLLDVGLPRATKIMQKAPDREFMEDFLKLLEYFKPKLARIENNNNHNFTQLELIEHTLRALAGKPKLDNKARNRASENAGKDSL